MTDLVRISFETGKNYWQKRHRIDKSDRDYIFYAKIPKDSGLLRFVKSNAYNAAHRHKIQEYFEIADIRFIYGQEDITGTTKYEYMDAVNVYYHTHFNIRAMLTDFHMGYHSYTFPKLIEDLLKVYRDDLHDRREKGFPYYNKISWYVKFDIMGSGFENNIYRATNLYNPEKSKIFKWYSEMENILNEMQTYYDDYKNVVLKEIGVNFRKRVV